MNEVVIPKAKAYSYIRMSTERQLSGDSLRRQLEQTRAYASSHNLLLDESLRDIGVSAYSGDNVENGALGRFLQMVNDGRVARGSYLIVESLDRLSRMQVLDALPPFINLLKAGIVIVTLADNQTYSYETVGSNPSQLIISLTIMSRAHEESLQKSKRISAALQAKRKAAMQGTGRYNFNLPGWIDVIKDANGEIEYRLNERADVVRLIYELTAEGMGQMAVAKTLIERDIPTFKGGKGWHQASVAYLLRAPAVIGTFAPQRFDPATKRYSADGPPIPNYFPAAINHDLYVRAQAIRRKRVNKGRKGKGFANLFAGMTFCAHCHGPMTIYYSGNGTKHLRCYNRLRTYARDVSEPKAYQCVNGRGFKYDELEKAILDNVHEYKLHEIFGKPNDTSEMENLAKSLLETSAKLDAQRSVISGLVKELAIASDDIRPALRSGLKDATDQQKALEDHIDVLKARRLEIEAHALDATNVERMIEEERQRWPDLDEAELYRSRSRIHTAYKRFVQFISFDATDRDATLIIANGYRAYKFAKGKLIAKFDAQESGMITGRVGGMTFSHFASDLIQYNQDGTLRDTVIEAIEERRSVLSALDRQHKLAG